jgi:hydroxypyruvate isomerase
LRVKGRDAIAYVLSKLGCQHPFVFSRIILYAELEYLKDKGERLTDFTYIGGPGTFYIEGLKEIIEPDDCFEKREGDPSKGIRGCISYRCPPPELPEEAKEYLDKAIEELKGLSDFELNKRVLEHPYYKKLVKQG